MNTTHEEKRATAKLVKITKVYLLDNFHKFSEANKIKISLAILTKAMPTEIEHSGSVQVVAMKDVSIGNRTMEFSVG